MVSYVPQVREEQMVRICLYVLEYIVVMCYHGDSAHAQAVCTRPSPLVYSRNVLPWRYMYIEYVVYALPVYPSHCLGVNSILRILKSILHSSATRDPVAQSD